MRNKYFNKKTIIKGVTFASKSEAEAYINLLCLLNEKKIKDLRLQEKFELIPKIQLSDGTKQRAIVYIADFVFYDVEKKKTRVIDIKGFATKEYKIKKKLFNYIYKDSGLILEEKI